MAKPDGSWVRTQLSGMDERLTPDPATAERIVNMRHDPEGYWSPMPGIEGLNREVEGGGTGPFPTGSGAILSVQWYQPRPNQRWLVVEQAIDDTTSEISYANVQSGVLTTISSRSRVLSQDLGTLFIENDRWLYLFSPVDGPVRWNGNRVAPVGFPGPVASPTVEGPDQGFTYFDRAGGTYPSNFKHRTRQRGVGEFPTTADEAWRLGYCQTEINDLGHESPPSPVVWATGSNTSADGWHFARLRSPRSAKHIRGKRIYRTRNMAGVSDPGSGVIVYLHSEWPTASCFDLIDHLQDGELGLPMLPDQTGPMPTGIRAAAFWQSSLWVGGMADYPTQLRYSVGGLPEQMPAIRRLPIGTDRTGPIVALRAVPRGLAVFKTGGIYMVIGNEIAGYHVETITEGVGCAAPRAIELVPGAGLLFLDTSGPYALVGALNDSQPTSVIPIGDEIRKTWRRRVGLSLVTATSVYDPYYAEVWFQVPQGGGVLPNLGLVYHLRLRKWSLREGFPVGCFARYKNRTWLGSWDDTDFPGVWLLTDGAADGFDGPVQGEYVTNPLTFDSHVQAQRVEVGLVGLGGSAFNISSSNDRAPWKTQSDTARPQKQATHERSVWGTARWSTTETWAEYDHARVQVSVLMMTGLEHQVRLTTTRSRLHQLALFLPIGGGTLSPLLPERP